MFRSIALLSALLLLPACVVDDDGFARVDGSETGSPDAPGNVTNGNSQFLAILGVTDDFPEDGDHVGIYLLSDGEPPANPVDEFGYVLCEVEDWSNEYVVTTDGSDIQVTDETIAERLAEVVEAEAIEAPVVSQIGFEATEVMTDGEFMLVNEVGADFRLAFAIDRSQ
jgi:hypothetical protein